MAAEILEIWIWTGSVSSEMIEFLFVTHKTAQLFANIAGDRPNFLSSLPNTDKLFASLTEDWPTVCQPVDTQNIK